LSPTRRQTGTDWTQACIQFGAATPPLCSLSPVWIQICIPLGVNLSPRHHLESVCLQLEAITGRVMEGRKRTLFGTAARGAVSLRCRIRMQNTHLQTCVHRQVLVARQQVAGSRRYAARKLVLYDPCRLCTSQPRLCPRKLARARRATTTRRAAAAPLATCTVQGHVLSARWCTRRRSGGMGRSAASPPVSTRRSEGDNARASGAATPARQITQKRTNITY
jgi:hypothetical protein